MSGESNIILITNDIGVEKILKPKLVLLREIDNIKTVSYSEAAEKINTIFPEMVILYCAKEKEQCIEIIKAIRADEKTQRTSILLVVKEYNQDFILNAYDEDITDYLTLDSDDAEILMRSIWCLKKNLVMTTVDKQHHLLEDLGIVDKTTNFYSKEYCEKIFKNEIRNLKEVKNAEAILMLASASEESKTKLNPTLFAKAIKKSIRNSDVVIHGNANRFYILLMDTNLKGAFCVWEKIKQTIGTQYSINAGVSFVGEKTFEELQKELLNALLEANSSNQDLVIVSEEVKNSSQDWLDKINSTQKNFKLFKQAFNKKLDKVITPVFFQLQKLYEEKLYKTQIEQYSNSTLSSFVLKKSNNVSELKISYPGFSKINIDVIHQGLDSPENRRISLDLAELDETRLIRILEDFIKEFKTFTDE